MKNSIIVLLVSAVLLSCGGYNTAAIQKIEKGQLKFVGNVLNANISIDDGKVFILDKADVVYEISPGMHVIKIYKDDQLVVNRNINVANDVIMEIEIP